jgi:predicted MPP superfamily phosphohydrolase
MAIFISVFIVLLTFVWFFVWSSLVLPLQLSGIALNFVLSIFIGSYLLQILRWMIYKQRKQSLWIILPAYFFFGLMIHLFFASLVKVAVIAVFDDLNETKISLLLLMLATVANLWGVKTALRGPLVKRVKIPVAKDYDFMRDVKIVQISDLHVGPVIKKRYVENVARICNSLDPDILVLTGDIGDGAASELIDDLKPLSSIRAKIGKYYVTGNHEYYWDATNWIASIEQIGAKPLLNSGVSLGQIWIGGVTDISSHQFISDHVSSPERAALGSKSNQYKILLAHQPKSCYEAEKAGFDLMLSGHTHNGQFFPFSLLVGFFNPYSKDLNRHSQKLSVYVNAGTGFWGPPLRLWVPSEITLIEFNAE